MDCKEAEKLIQPYVCLLYTSNNRYTFFERNTGCRVEAERSRTMLEKIKEILVEQLNCDADSINEDTSVSYTHLTGDE